MADLIYLLVLAAFLGVCVMYVKVCDRLTSTPDPSASESPMPDSSSTATSTNARVSK